MRRVTNEYSESIAARLHTDWSSCWSSRSFCIITAISLPEPPDIFRSYNCAMMPDPWLVYLRRQDVVTENTTKRATVTCNTATKTCQSVAWLGRPRCSCRFKPVPLPSEWTAGSRRAATALSLNRWGQLTFKIPLAGLLCGAATAWIFNVAHLVHDGHRRSRLLCRW